MASLSELRTEARETLSEAEVARLDAVEATSWARVLVTSDLHLGEGVDPATGRTARHENFFADAPFARFVAAEQAALAPDAPALLILDGDVLDFPRITAVPEGDDAYAAWSRLLAALGAPRDVGALKASARRFRERRYGLASQDFKSVWKLARIVDGHPGFFTALAGWVEAGGHLLFVKGNHDVELSWSLVRRALERALVAHGASPEGVEARVAFCMRGVLLDNAWIEHGHPYEALTRVVGPALLKDATVLNEPLGSYLNRYLVNPMEGLSPFLDNVKPIQGVLWRILRYHPLRSLGLCLRALWVVPQALRARHSRQLLESAFYFGFILLGWAAFFGFVRLIALGLTGRLDDVGRDLVHWGGVGVALAVLVPVGLSALREIRSWFERHRDDPYVRAAVAGAPDELTGAPAGTWGRRYVVVGHTHEQDAQRFDVPGRDVGLVLNTGTWIALWSDERPDLHGRTLHPFVRLTRTDDGPGFVHAHLQWDDPRGAASPSLLLSTVVEADVPD